MKFLPLIFSQLRRKKLRTTLTLLSIMVAFILYGYLSAITRALDQGVSVVGADRLIARHKVSIAQLLPVTYGPRIARIPGVSLVSHATWFGGIYQEPRNFFAQMPVEPEKWLALYPEFLLSDEERDRWLSTRTGAIAGRKTAEKYGWKVGDRIPIQATIWTQKDGSRVWEFDLVGIYDGAKQGTDTTQFFFRYDYFDEARRFAKGQVGWYVIKVDDPALAESVAAGIDAEFANSTAETKAETEGAFVQGFAKQIGDVGLIMKVILAAVFFTILLVAGNTMAQSVRERTEELGVLKAMGFTHAQVMGMVLGESCLISALGGGLGLAIASMLIAAGDPTRGALPMFYFPPEDLARGVVLLLILGVITGAFPAWQAMRLSIASALRRVQQ